MNGSPDLAGSHDSAAWRAARRGVARAHHPDRGGDPKAYLAALVEIDARFGRLPAGPRAAGVVGVHRNRSLSARAARAAGRIRRVAVRVGERLPQRVRPGRRYIEL